MRVWTDCKLHKDAAARLDAIADLHGGGNLAELPGAEAVILSSNINADDMFMDQAGESLKVIARPGIGVDNVDVPAATAREILVINTPDAPTESTAEHAVALLLSISKRVVMGDMSMRGTDIPRSRMLGTEVRGRILGVVGFGRIGRRVAEICQAGLEMRVMVYDPFVGREEVSAVGAEWVNDLDSMLTQADFVTLHAALSTETRGLIGEREQQMMKPGAYLINVARGPMVDEVALIRSLESGHLAGAALDVFDPEPPLADNPLFTMDNVVVTPHIGSFTDLGTQGMGGGVVDQLIQIRQGERPTFLVNPDAWPGRAVAFITS